MPSPRSTCVRWAARTWRPLMLTPSSPDGRARGPRIGYSALIDRPPLRWRGGARVALWVQMNLEHFEPFGPGTTLPPTPREQPRVDAKNAGWRDYGARVGIWRLMNILDRHSVRASAPINTEVLTVYPEV